MQGDGALLTVGRRSLTGDLSGNLEAVLMGVGMYCKVCVGLQSWSAEEGLGTEMAKPLWREAVVPLLSQHSLFSLLTDTRSGCRPRASCWIELRGQLGEV